MFVYIISSALAIAVSIIPTCSQMPSRLYVSESSTASSPDGSSWTNAYTDLQDALAACDNGDLVFVAEGTYYPTTDTDRSISFSIPSGCELYGGFEGISSETRKTDRPNPLKTVILDGDIGIMNDQTDNSYHVVELDSDVVVDGFTIKNGYGKNNDDITDYYSNSGGGMAISSTSTTFKLNDIIFENNIATQGGALYVFGSTNKGIDITNCTFNNNEAIDGDYRGGYGGAVFLSYNADTTFIDCQFNYNTAELRGGAIYQDYGSNVIISNCILNNNKVTYGHGGAIFSEDRNSQFGSTPLEISNSQIKNNRAGRYGGGVLVFNGASANFSKVIFSNNTAEIDGGVGQYAATWTYADNCFDCTFTNNIATQDSSTNDYETDGFTSYSSVTFGAYNETYYLKELYLNSLTNTVSLSEKSTSSIIIYVDTNTPAAQNSQDGTTWNLAYNTIQEGIDKLCDNGYGDTAEIWVATGQYTPTDVPSWSSTSTPKDKSFILCEDATIYGGFDGTETSRNERNWYNNPTYFWGEVTSGNYAQQIVIGAHNSRIDGMIFARGYGNTATNRRLIEIENEEEKNIRRRLISTSIDDVISEKSRIRGGGLFVNSSDMNIVNSLFIENFSYKGGGAYCMGYHASGNRHARFYNVGFVNNGAGLRGGAIAADAYCNFYCEYCLIVGNVGQKGGSVYLDFGCGPTFNNTIFEENIALEVGGAVAIDGGGSITISNSIAKDNQAGWEGGAFYSGSFSPFSTEFNVQTVTLKNITFSGNICPYGHTDLWSWGNGEFSVTTGDISFTSSPVTPSPTTFGVPITPNPSQNQPNGPKTPSPTTPSGVPGTPSPTNTDGSSDSYGKRIQVTFVSVTMILIVCGFLSF